jgi:hypothetical protein
LARLYLRLPPSPTVYEYLLTKYEQLATMYEAVDHDEHDPPEDHLKLAGGMEYR